MRKITVLNNLSLDGVMQAPGGRDEDTRGGFPHGGWAQPYNDPVMAGEMGAGMAREGALLFGRRTYEQFAAFWPHQPSNPITDLLNARQKYVVSRTLTAPLPWQNSTVLAGDPVGAVARLKAQPGPDLTILGSGQLVRALLGGGLIDELTLSVHPLLLGSGRRLFADDGALAKLHLVKSVPTTTGVIIATYRPTAPTAD